MRVHLIRHGATAGNLERRYVGSTDEPLSEPGRESLRARAYPQAVNVYVSPMRRAMETAEMLYPGAPKIVVPDFREIGFGEFEYKNYEELSGDPRYQAFIDSGGTVAFPGGESRTDFINRTAAAFSAIVGNEANDFAIVAHGGTVMAILAAFLDPPAGYFDHQLPPGGCATVEAGMFNETKTIKWEGYLS